MLKDSTSHQELIKRLKMQSKQIEDMKKNKVIVSLYLNPLTHIKANFS